MIPQASPKPGKCWELPSRTRRIQIDGMTVYATLVLKDGKPFSLILNCSKQGTLAHGLLRLLGETASLALQEGVPLAKICERWRFSAFDPAGLTKDPQIPLVSSPADAVARWLESLTKEPDGKGK